MKTNLTHKIGFWSAIVAIGLVLVYILLHLLTDIHLIHGIKESILIFLPHLLLAPTFLLIVICLHYSVRKENKIWTSIAISLTSVYCAQIVMLYLIQFILLFNDLPQKQLAFNKGLFDSNSFLLTIDALTYFFISLSSLFLAIALKGNRWIFRPLIWNGLLVLLLFLSIFYPLFYFVGAIWIISFIMAMIEISFFFRISYKTNLDTIS
jgi:hypothetical protein